MVVNFLRSSISVLCLLYPLESNNSVLKLQNTFHHLYMIFLLIILFQPAHPLQILELPNHPFYVGVQFHPEFKSRPGRPSAPFLGTCGIIMLLYCSTMRNYISLQVVDICNLGVFQCFLPFQYALLFALQTIQLMSFKLLHHKFPCPSFLCFFNIYIVGTIGLILAATGKLGTYLSEQNGCL